MYLQIIWSSTSIYLCYLKKKQIQQPCEYKWRKNLNKFFYCPLETELRSHCGVTEIPAMLYHKGSLDGG